MIVNLTDMLKRDSMNLYFINYNILRGDNASFSFFELSAYDNGLCS
jgi:hypothetical protein